MACNQWRNTCKRALRRVNATLDSLETDISGNTEIELAQDNDVANSTVSSQLCDLDMAEEGVRN